MHVFTVEGKALWCCLEKGGPYTQFVVPFSEA